MGFVDKDLTEKIIGCAYAVHKALGSGFLEKVYENAMVIELGKRKLEIQQQAPITVKYDESPVGEYFADLLVEERVICELKAVDVFAHGHEIQLVHYLTATGIDTGLLINFGDSVTVRRKFRQYRNPVYSAESC